MASINSIRLWFKIAKWPHVRVTPEDTRITVFSNGTAYGSNSTIPTGGHCTPNSIVGDKLLWKNAQKNDTNSITSEAINKSIPIFILRWTINVWYPCQVASRIISRHHWYIIIKININERNKPNKLFNHIQATILIVIRKEPQPTRIGHGLILTMWNGVNIIK